MLLNLSMIESSTQESVRIPEDYYVIFVQKEGSHVFNWRTFFANTILTITRQRVQTDSGAIVVQNWFEDPYVHDIVQMPEDTFQELKRRETGATSS